MASKNEELLAKGLERVWSHGEVALFVSQGALQAQDRERLLKTDSDNLTLTTTTANQIGLERSWAGSLAPKIKLDALAGEVEVRVPPATPHQLYSRFKDGVLYLSNLCDAIPGGDIIEPAALYSLLQFGAIVPPFSTKASVRRLAPGELTIFDLATQRIKARTASPDSLLAYSLAQEPAGIQKTEAELERELATAIDQSMLSACPDGRAIILFSGGVDSALLASRAKKLGWEDTRLVHLSFGAEDLETKIAREIAKELGLSFEVVEFKGSAVDVARGVLRGPVPPFADHSLIPTSLLMKEIQERFGSEFVVFDGVGADEGFGIGAKLRQWEQIYKIPHQARWFLGEAYKVARLSKRRGRSEAILKIMRRAGYLDLIAASILAQNPLAGIAYQFPEGLRTEVEEELATWNNLVMGRGALDRALGAGLSLVAPGVFAQKTVYLEREENLRVHYPFLADELIAYITRYGSIINQANEPKAILKRLLARVIPAEYVYRRKQGFTSPLTTILRSEKGRILLSELFPLPEPLQPFVVEGVVRKYLDKIEQGKNLPPQTLNFLWSLIVLSAWLRAHPRDLFV